MLLSYAAQLGSGAGCMSILTGLDVSTNFNFDVHYGAWGRALHRCKPDLCVLHYLWAMPTLIHNDFLPCHTPII